MLAGCTQTGIQLYSRLRARLSEASPVEPSSPAVPAIAARRTRNAPGWTIRHSLWMLPALLFGGLGAWISSGYIAVRHKCQSWAGVAVAYVTLELAATALMASLDIAHKRPALPANSLTEFDFTRITDIAYA